MGQPAAKKGDKVMAIDQHTIISAGVGSLVPHPFTGIIDGALSSNVNILGQAAATVDSTATNTPPHIPIGGTFATPPSNKATISSGSGSVNINGKKAARTGDKARTCDEVTQEVGSVLAVGTVMIGG
jgi:uncharacterized Zn-binding protein involved in type VI secretion